MSNQPDLTNAMPQPPTSESDTAEGGLRQGAQLLGRQLLELAHEHLQLAALEARLAGYSLVAMVAAGVMVAFLLVSTWIGLIAAVIVATGNAGGLPLGAAIALGAAANLPLVLLLCMFIRHRSRHLMWPASMRSLKAALPSQDLGTAS